MMRKGRMMKAVVLSFVIVTLTACGSTDTSNTKEKEQNDIDTEQNVSATYITPTVENGEIVISTDSLSEHALYVNYDSNGTNIQMIAVKASDGSARLSLNTCQACNPSPKAYFTEEDGRLVCQNCGNVFTMDSVGETSGGCNPMNINYETTDGSLVVSAGELDNYADDFIAWSGPVE